MLKAILSWLPHQQHSLLASPDVGNCGMFNVSGHFRAAQTLKPGSMAYSFLLKSKTSTNNIKYLLFDTALVELAWFFGCQLDKLTMYCHSLCHSSSSYTNPHCTNQSINQKSCKVSSVSQHTLFVVSQCLHFFSVLYFCIGYLYHLQYLSFGQRQQCFALTRCFHFQLETFVYISTAPAQTLDIRFCRFLALINKHDFKALWFKGYSLTSWMVVQALC